MFGYLYKPFSLSPAVQREVAGLASVETRESAVSMEPRLAKPQLFNFAYQITSRASTTSFSRLLQRSSVL